MCTYTHMVITIMLCLISEHFVLEVNVLEAGKVGKHTI